MSDGTVRTPLYSSRLPPEDEQPKGRVHDVTLQKKLEFIRRCRTLGRGSRTKLRLLVPPRARIEAFPRATPNPRAGLPVRAGLNRSLDRIHPKLPHVADDVRRPRTAPAPTRTQFGWVPPSSPVASRPNTTAMLMHSGHPRPKSPGSVYDGASTLRSPSPTGSMAPSMVSRPDDDALVWAAGLPSDPAPGSLTRPQLTRRTPAHPSPIQPDQNQPAPTPNPLPNRTEPPPAATPVSQRSSRSSCWTTRRR